MKAASLKKCGFWRHSSGYAIARSLLQATLKAIYEMTYVH